MNRKDYINKLMNNLQGLPMEEVQDILSDYEEHFEIGLSKGKSEEEIASELGDPREVAEGYRSNYKYTQKEETLVINSNDNSKKFILGLLLIGVNIVVLFVPAMTLFGILMGLFGMGVGFTFGGIGMLFRFPFGYLIGTASPHILTSIGLGFGLGALGLLVLVFTAFLIKIIFNLVSKYVKWNIELINR